MAVSQSSKVNTKRNLLQSAYEYVASGWPVIPLYSPAKPGGRSACSCGNPKCQAPAKHPRISNWINAASLDPDQVSDWWTRWPQANIGVILGHRSGLIDIETDVKSDGPDNLLDLMKHLGELPLTATFRSGSGGIHHLYQMPEGFAVKKQIHFGKDILHKPTTGIDVLGEGCYAVFPPSLHICGKHYEWAS